MKTLGRILIAIETIAIAMVLATYLDVVSHNRTPESDGYWFESTEAIGEWLEQRAE